jgi:hypothetical protein
MKKDNNLQFQTTLKTALDTYHPRWKGGFKRKTSNGTLASFDTVTEETIKNWVSGRRHPKSNIFAAFLDETDFPPEIRENLSQLYEKISLKPSHTQPSQPIHVENSSDLDQSVPTVSVAPATSKRLWISLLILGLGLSLASVTLALLTKTQIDPSSEVGVVSLISPSNDVLSIKTSNQTIVARGEVTAITPIKVGEMVTVFFAIQNSDTHPIRIKSLGCGAQGPSNRKADWSDPMAPFPTVSDIFLQPGEIYEFRQSRAFFAPGNYFVEPTMEDALGRWGGVQPFSRINFVVK